MCNLSQGFVNEGIVQGLEKGLEKSRAEGLTEGKAVGLAVGKVEGLAQAVLSLMNNMHIDIDKAMDFVNITNDLRPAILNCIQSKEAKQ